MGFRIVSLIILCQDEQEDTEVKARMTFKKTLLLLAAGLSLSFCASTQKKTVADKEKDAQYQYEKAVVALRYDLPDQAIEYLQQAIALNPSHDQSYNLLGLAYIKTKNYAEAAAAYQKYLELKPDVSDVHCNLGLVYEELGEKDKAEAEYKKAMAIDGNPNASFNLAKLYYGQNNLEQALEYARASIKKKSDLAAAHNLEGVILNQMGRYGEALGSFEKALGLAPNDINLSVNLGIAYINNKQFGKAREILEKALPAIQDQTLKDKVTEYLKLIKE
jgi:tetratricopeptide (TPR) repeat protein